MTGWLTAAELPSPWFHLNFSQKHCHVAPNLNFKIHDLGEDREIVLTHFDSQSGVEECVDSNEAQLC